MMKKYHFFIFLVLGILSCKKSPTDSNNPSTLYFASLYAINGNNSVTLAWTNIINGEAYDIEIHRSDEENFTPSRSTLFSTISPTNTSFVDSSTQNDVSYYYRIVPYEKIGDKIIAGEPSNVVLAKPFNYDSSFTIKYSEHIQRIFTSSCAVEACHEGSEGKRFIKKGIGNSTLHNGQFSLQSWNDAVNGGDNVN